MSKKTPKRQNKREKDEAAAPSPHFSELLVSPGRSPIQGQLTGSARKVKDTCADWHNAIFKWDKLCAKGMNLITEIANLKIQSSESNNTENEHENTMPQGLQKLCDDLADIISGLAEVVEKMTIYTANLKGIADLEWYQQNQSFSEEPLFQTWTTDVFYETSKQLLDMYQAELPVKRAVMENVAHAPSRDVLMFHSAVWLHQVYITDRSKLLLESMLTETGHR